MIKEKFMSLFSFFKEIFDLQEGKEEEYNTIETIKKGIEFKGTNLWVLIFAIFIASIGLNVNSTAVIIGAMLISPLMGPIMGLGLGLGIYDFELIKKSLKNLTIAVVISLTTSSLYFLLTPLREAQSEILARTYPTIWDVFIAFLGGLAGIIAITRKDKGNAIPGVAIATALMPPLCTAGYGIASGNFLFFLGAFYLFFINSVFISLSTFLIVRFLKFPQINFIDLKLEKKIKRYVYLILIFTIIPSIYLGYNIVQKSIFENKINLFIKNEINSNKQQILKKSISFEKRRLELLYTGKSLTEEETNQLKQKLNSNYITNIELVFKHATESGGIDVTSLKTGIIEELYKKNLELLEEKDLEIQTLQEELNLLKNKIPVEEIAKELKVQYPDIEKISITKGEVTSFKERDIQNTNISLIIIYSKKKISKIERKKIIDWLSIRTKENQLEVLFQ